MSRSQGFASFMHKEFLKKQMMARSGRLDPVRFMLDSSKGAVAEKPYQLKQESATMLAKIADGSCFKCHGKGIGKWSRGGLVAAVCTCVQRKLPALQKTLEEQRARLTKELEEAKAAEQANVSDNKPSDEPSPVPATEVREQT